jgi:hypothetical protein
MPPEEDMKDMVEEEKVRLRTIKSKNKDEDKRLRGEELGALGSLVVVGRALEIAAAVKKASN